MGQAITILRVGVRDVGFGFAEFGLREFDDRAQSQVVARLREIQREVCFLAELLCDGQPLVRLIRLLPACANVARDVVA